MKRLDLMLKNKAEMEAYEEKMRKNEEYQAWLKRTEEYKKVRELKERGEKYVEAVNDAVAMNYETMRKQEERIKELEQEREQYTYKPKHTLPSSAYRKIEEIEDVLRSEVSIHKEANRLMRRECEDLEKERDELKRECADLRQDNRILSNSHAEIVADRDMALDKLEDAKREVDFLEECNNKAVKERDMALRENEKLGRFYDTKCEHFDELSSMLRDKDNDLQNMTKSRDAMHSKVLELEQELEDKCEQYDEMKKEMGDKESVFQNMIKDRNMMYEDRNKLRERLKGLEKDNEDVVTRLKWSTEQLIKKQNQLDEIDDEWRIKCGGIQREMDHVVIQRDEAIRKSDKVDEANARLAREIADFIRLAQERHRDIVAEAYQEQNDTIQEFIKRMTEECLK